MNYISDILYWISTGLLVPVIVLLIILFIRSLLLIGGFFGQYVAIRKTEALLKQEFDRLTPDTVAGLGERLPDAREPWSSATSAGCWKPERVRHTGSACWPITRSWPIRTGHL